PPFGFTSPWHPAHFSTRRGRTVFSKNSASASVGSAARPAGCRHGLRVSNRLKPNKTPDLKRRLSVSQGTAGTQNGPHPTAILPRPALPCNELPESLDSSWAAGWCHDVAATDWMCDVGFHFEAAEPPGKPVARMGDEVKPSDGLKLTGPPELAVARP